MLILIQQESTDTLSSVYFTSVGRFPVQLIASFWVSKKQTDSINVGWRNLFPVTWFQVTNFPFEVSLVLVTQLWARAILVLLPSWKPRFTFFCSFKDVV